MLGYYPSKFWKYCWTFFTPLLIFVKDCLYNLNVKKIVFSPFIYLQIVFVFSIVQYQPFKYNDYEYPWYGVAIGNLVFLLFHLFHLGLSFSYFNRLVYMFVINYLDTNLCNTNNDKKIQKTIRQFFKLFNLFYQICFFVYII